MSAGKFAIYTNSERLSDDVIGRLTELELREADNAISTLRLRFSLAQMSDGRFSILDEQSFEPGMVIALELAAPGGTESYLFSGYLAHLRPHFEGIESNAYLDVLAFDSAMVLESEERVASYPDASDSDAVSEILDRYSILASIDSSAAHWAEDDRLLVQRGTDWSFVQQMARRNGFVVYFEPDPISGDPHCHFGLPKLADEPQADLIIMREGSNLSWIDFQVAHDQPQRRIGSAINPIRKQLIRVDSEPDSDILGETRYNELSEQGLVRAGATAAQRFIRSAMTDDAALNAAAAGLAAADHMAIEVRGEVDPSLYRGLLRAHRPVLIRGVGDSLSGVYYVHSVRTVQKDGELTQSFIALSNALGRSGREDFGQTAEEEPPL